jgi:beta-phosphoglucomutase-like phosphatase (HAD superfamily)
MMTKERGLPKGLHRYIDALKQKYTFETIHILCRPMFIHEYAFSRLKKDGYMLAVASNSIRETVDTMIDKACLAQYLEFALSNQDIKNAKPDPEIYVTAIARLGLTPQDCLVVEDNQHGIQAAEGAKAHVMRVETIHDVTYDNIAEYIKRLEGGR